MLHMQQKVVLRHARPALFSSGVKHAQLPTGVTQHFHPPSALTGGHHCPLPLIMLTAESGLAAVPQSRDHRFQPHLALGRRPAPQRLCPRAIPKRYKIPHDDTIDSYKIRIMMTV